MKENKRWRGIGIGLVVFLAIFSILFLAFNFILNLGIDVFQKTLGSGSLLQTEKIELDASMLLSFPFLGSAFLFYVALFVLSFTLSLVGVFKVLNSFGRLNKDQKGSARFTTFQEIQQQYRDVPDRKERFSGSGGVPIARYKDRLFIDDSPVNNLIIGTTRSGKGETFVFSAIDIYSRAEEQASMVINDPKGELFSASNETLEKLGYHVEVLNLMNPIQSMSYNLLQLTIDAFMEGNYSLAQQYARSVAFMLYYDPTSKDPFWANSSTDLCTALILALCEQCRHEPEKINMYNVALMLSDLGTRTVEDANGQEISALDDFFGQFPENHPAKMQYATINFSGGQTRASILANTNAKLGVFTLDGTAKLTSQNSYDMTLIGFGRWIKAKTTPDTRVTLTFPNGKTETIRSDADGMFTLYHKNPLRHQDDITIRVGEMDATIRITEKEGTLRGACDHEPIEIREVMQHDKPTAIFMITPDYDATFHVIASLYVKQVYTNLARVASQAEGGKCHREVIFLLDEFGNMPPIEDMSNIITVCLGRNIRFNLIIQAYSQLENLYDKEWKTIDGNCGNTLYLLTADESTAELISKKLGEQTIVTKSRSGQTVSLNKSRTENVDARRLLTATEVMGLKEGEMIVIRVIKRQDKNRNRIQSYPIYLTGKTALKYRWEYLADDYDTSKSINEMDIPCAHAMIDLNELKADFKVNQFAKRKRQQEEAQEEKELLEKEREEQRQEAAALLAKRKQDLARNRHAQRKQEKREQENEGRPADSKPRIQTNRVISQDVLLAVYDDPALAKKYGEMDLLAFRDILLADSEKIADQKTVAVMVSKITFALNKLNEKEEAG
ncbi:hypothetical protein BEP19_16790 [Ammoniphilus oxalaticus]|uniref:TraD/TraG TraM recognition site domain-containing protein n=2 Tax=Ammoniphilus oxalaticus TaxID=66863 RepID=A0A419SQ94_9BACL|nr:hypothetical protein BEP19_16790 [Ammoniphilus oxalaticus]